MLQADIINSSSSSLIVYYSCMQFTLMSI